MDLGELRTRRDNQSSDGAVCTQYELRKESKAGRRRNEWFYVRWEFIEWGIILSFYKKMRASNERYIYHQRRLLNYFSSVRGMFKRGTIRFRIEKNELLISYHQTELQWGISAEVLVSYKEGNEGKRWMIWEIQDFVISCYYEFERDKSPMKLKDLACLCGVGVSALGEQIKNILDKLNRFISQEKNGNKFL